MDIEGLIELRYTTDEWGPFSVDLDGGLPAGETISDVAIKAYTGMVSPSSLISGLTDIASQIIETGSILYNGTSIQWKMQYPADASLKGKKVTLVFEVTASGGGEHPFFFYAVSIA